MDPIATVFECFTLCLARCLLKKEKLQKSPKNSSHTHTSVKKDPISVCHGRFSFLRDKDSPPIAEQSGGENIHIDTLTKGSHTQEKGNPELRCAVPRSPSTFSLVSCTVSLKHNHDDISSHYCSSPSTPPPHRKAKTFDRDRALTSLGA